MLHRIIKTGLTLNFTLPAAIFGADTLKNETETEKKANIFGKQYETGWDRVKAMFEIDEFGRTSKEFTTVTNVAGLSLFIGAMYGGLMKSKTAYMDFMRNNQATAFNDHLHAKKKLQDAVTISFGKGAFMWSWRLCLFTTSFVGISTVISVYRGKSGILEYIGAGLLSGTLYKFNAGPRGWVVGGGLGAVLGFVGGLTTLGMCKLTGVSMEEVRYWQYHWRKQRDDYISHSIKEYTEKEQNLIGYEHDQKLGDKGKNLDDISD